MNCEIDQKAKERKEVYTSNGGNGKLTTDTMLWYLISKVDGLDDKLGTKVDRSTFQWIIGILFTLFIMCLGLIANNAGIIG